MYVVLGALMTAVSKVNDVQIQIPQNTYFVPRHKQGHQLSNSDDHIIEKKPLTGLRIGAHKLKGNADYFKKGFDGSQNSNFYEFLSTGMFPYITGSAMFIALSTVANKFFSTQDRFAATKHGKNMALGVILYAGGKWLGSKLINKLTHASTGIDLEMPYKKIVTELPEGPDKQERVREEFHRVFESRDFPRHDLLVKMGEAEGNRYGYYDKITKKMGYEDRLNAPDQIVNEKIKEVITKATVGKNVSSYLWAALGVAFASQEAIANFKFTRIPHAHKQNLKNFKGGVKNTIKEAAKQLWKGSGDNAHKKGIVGKVLIGAALASTVISWFNVSSGFNKGKAHGKSAVDFKKDYEGV